MSVARTADRLDAILVAANAEARVSSLIYLTEGQFADLWGNKFLDPISRRYRGVRLVVTQKIGACVQ